MLQLMSDKMQTLGILDHWNRFVIAWTFKEKSRIEFETVKVLSVSQLSDLQALNKSGPRSIQNTPASELLFEKEVWNLSALQVMFT